MNNFLGRVSKFLNIGRSRYIVGYDLAGNSYIEAPSKDGSKDPRHARRAIDWKEKKQLGDYDQREIPVQWTMWLRHTRRDPPTLQELQTDKERIERVQANARLLAIKDEEMRQREQKARQLEHEEAKQRSQQQLISSTSSTARVPRSTRVPTSTVTDIDSQAVYNVGASETISESVLDATQPRTPNDDVWAASRARLAAKGQLASSDSATPVSDAVREAMDKRASKRAEIDSQETEKERAKREVTKNPLEAFVPMPKIRS